MVIHLVELVPGGQTLLTLLSCGFKFGNHGTDLLRIAT